MDTERDLCQIDVGIVEHAQCGVALRSQVSSIESCRRIALDPNDDAGRRRHAQQRGVVVERGQAIVRAEVNSGKTNGGSRHQAAAGANASREIRRGNDQPAAGEQSV
jgi:hypothetical protein